eukprot:Lithocolla_globosa_v1_NODE_305_length_4584_cov_10.581365.p1 type:complete len:1026 gc:universal NODE_305_length_4584_cov_10.581365:1203-4280(+)
MELVQELHALLANTLNPNFEIRTQAETQLLHQSKKKGFASNLLLVVSTEEVDQGVRHSGVIYFKNLIHKSWQPLEPAEGERQPFVISEEDKVLIKSNIVEAVIRSPALFRSQLLFALNVCARHDFPEKWPELLQKVCQYLEHNDQNVVYGALLTLLEIVRKYELKNTEKRGPLSEIMKATFPTMFKLYVACLPLEVPEAALVVKTINKIFFSCIQFALPLELLETKYIQPWLELLVQLIEKPMPAIEATLDSTERPKYPWWKALKWAYQILNRLFSRYGNPNLAEQHYLKFSKHFLKNFSVTLLTSYLKRLDLVRQGQYMSPRVKQLSLNFIGDALEHSITWKVLKPMFVPIVSDVIFPLLCHTAEDDELWETDPYEYVRLKFDIYEDFKSPVTAAQNLVNQAASLRKKHTLIPMLQFCNEVLTSYQNAPPESKNHKSMDGVLCMIGSLSSILDSDQGFKSELEQLIIVHVLPQFQSPVGFLRARACWMVHQYSEVDMTNPEHDQAIIRCVVAGLRDKDLPVRIEAALTLGAVVGKEMAKQEVLPYLSDIMHELLKLTNESDLDDINNVMQRLIEYFPDEMTPFAVQMCLQLKETFMRAQEEEETGEDEEGTFAMLATGVLRTVVFLVRAMGEAPAILKQLEGIFIPVIRNILETENLDYFDEVLELISACTECSDCISPEVWTLFPTLYSCFKNCAFDFFSEMMPSFANFVGRDPSVFVSQPQNVHIMLDIIKTVLVTNKASSGEEEKGLACFLFQLILLNCRGSFDAQIPEALEWALVTYSEAETLPLKIHSLELLISCLYYNPILTLEILEKVGQTSFVFTHWFQKIEKFTRVYDKKLVIVTLCQMFSLPFEQLPETLRAGWGQSMLLILNVFEGLPTALQTRQAMLEYDEDDDDDLGAMYEQEDEIEDEDGDVFDEDDAATLENLAEKAKEVAKREAGGEDEDDDDWNDFGMEEDFDYETPLDNVDVYVVFHNTLQNLQQSNPQGHAALVSQLTPEHQTTITALLQQGAEAKNKEQLQIQQ